MKAKLGIAMLLGWTLVVTILRAVRLPNDFSKSHWLVDYRFGFVKRGLVGTLVSLATTTLHTRPTDQLIAILSSVQFGIFCVVLLGVGLRVIHRSGWSITAILTVLVFLSSPFVVMSAHLVGYYDNIIIVLAVISLALLLRGRRVWAASVQAIAILVHENAVLVCVPVFCLGWLLVESQHRQSEGARWQRWPLFLPVATFLILIVSQHFASRHLERHLTTYLSSYPFIERTIRDVRVPHWITITLYDSYLLHQGNVTGRLVSNAMLGLVFPSMAAILALTFDAYRLRALSVRSIVLLGVCLAPQLMQIVAWDTARIWTYSILSSFLALWFYAEAFPERRTSAQFVRFIGLLALFLNAVELTPLMDGLKDQFELQTRVLLYAPVLGAIVALMVLEESSLSP